MDASVILKPILWSPHPFNYLRPQGYKGVGKSFPATRGWGGEEWNAAPILIDSRAYFFVQEYGPIEALIDKGPTAVVMIAYDSKTKAQYVVGIACDVKVTSEGERRKLQRNYPLSKRYNELKKLPIVRSKYEGIPGGRKFGSWRERLFHDLKNGQEYHLALYSDAALYHWFKTPIRINARGYTKKNHFMRYFSKFQFILASHVIDMVDDFLPVKSPVLRWLRGIVEIEQKFKSNKLSSLSGSGKLGGGKAAQKAYSRYIECHEVVISPKHDKLDQDFSGYITAEEFGFVRAPLYSTIDARFTRGGRLSLVEYKTCELKNAYFALRAAVGQLIDYWIRLDEGRAQNLIAVLDCYPGSDGTMLIDGLNRKGIPISVFWRSKPKSGKFDSYAPVLK